METIRFDVAKTAGPFKIMNAVNNGPIHKRHSTWQSRSNLETYKAARIPFARNHDAAFCSSYGGEHTVDITAIFPNFDADPYDPASYDFAVTDEYVLVTREAGTEMFYRLGQKIEHTIKNFNIFPPKDFQKWAVICEHIIRHYNEGWADGFHFNMQYWEIWNEAGMDQAGAWPRHCWGGAKEEFFDFFAVTAKHLKKCFPELKIGGPASHLDVDWAAEFLAAMRIREVPLDFFSWHIYHIRPEAVVEFGSIMQKLMDENGYGNAENICNEWNYVWNFHDKMVYSIRQIIGLKGASFSLACMITAQKSCIDMMMYYNAGPGVYNGLFDYYTLEPLKGYYPFLWYGMFYDMETEIRSEQDPENLYTLCGKDKDGKLMLTITYYTNEDDAEEKSFRLDLGRTGTFEVYLLDQEHNGKLVDCTDDLTFTVKPWTCILLKEK